MTVRMLHHPAPAVSYLSAALAAVASAVGLLVPGFYHRDPDAIAPQLVGQDLVTLLVVVPLLCLATRAAVRGGARATILMAGALLYMAYTYTTYAFGTRFNALFLVYVAALASSVFALSLVLPRLPVGAVTLEVQDRLPRRALVATFTLFVVAFAFLWGIDVVPALLEGTAPAAAREAEMPTSPIHVLDLAFVLPLFAISSILLIRRNAYGALLSGVMLVKGMTIALAVLSMAGSVMLEGQTPNVPVAAAMLGVVLLTGLVGWRYLVAFSGGGGSPHATTAGRVPH